MTRDINYRTLNGYNALCTLIENCSEKLTNLPILDLLLCHGSDINQKTIDNDNAILLASIQNKLKFLKQLLAKEGADPNVENNKKVTPLIYFSATRNLQGVNLLFENQRTNANYLDSNKRSALHWAINNSSTSSDASYEIEELLLKHQCDINQIDVRGRIPIHYAFVKIGKPYDTKEIDPIEVVANITSWSDCNIDISDNYGNTPLCYAAQRGSVISS